MKAVLTIGIWVLASGFGFSASPLECRIELDRSVLPADSVGRAIVKVSLEAPVITNAQRPSVNLAIVLDRSGSMAGEKLDKAKQAAIEALRRMDGRDYFSLVTYDHEIRTVVPAQRAEHMEWIEAQIRGIQSGGNTALFGGVSQGASEVRKHLNRQAVHRILLLSDGLANVGPSQPEDLGRLGAALMKEGISVSTVGVGNDYNEDLMTRLSQNSDGNSYYVRSVNDLPHIFSRELGDVLNVVAKGVELTIECSSGVRPVRLVGREGRIRGQTASLTLNQLYGAQEKYVLLEVEIDRAVAGETRQIAQANVVYFDVHQETSAQAQASVSATFSSRQEEVVASTNKTVQRDELINTFAEAQDKAIELADQGQLDDAVQALNETQAVLSQVAQANEDPALRQKAEEIEKLTQELQSEGMSKEQRKAMRTKSYQLRNQQTQAKQKDQ